MKLSIIVPVYNLENYLERCLLSLCEQSVCVNDYEIIIINDGSEDKSLRIIEDFNSKYVNIKVVSQANSGQSAARNAGIQISKGEYLWFVDGDDWIERNSIKDLYVIIEKYKPDIISIGVQYCYDSSRMNDIFFRMSPQFNCQICSGIDLLRANTYNKGNAPWIQIVSSDILRTGEIQFTEGILHEDIEFNMKCLVLSKRVYLLNKVLYNYDCTRLTSTTNTPNILRLKGLMHTAQSCFELNQSDPFFFDYGSRFLYYSLISSFKMAVTGKSFFITEFSRKKRSYVKMMIRSSNLKFRVFACFFIMPTGVVYHIMKFLFHMKSFFIALKK